MSFVVIPIQVGELKQAMADGMGALTDPQRGTDLVRNVHVVQQVYQGVPEDIVFAHEVDPHAAAGSSFSFGLHTGMELMRRIAKEQPERVFAADMPGVIERLVEANGGQQNVHVEGFGYVSLDVSVAAIATVLAERPLPDLIRGHKP